MPISALHNAVNKRFRVQVQEAQTPNLPTLYDNMPEEEFEKPASGMWARVKLLIDDEQQADFGDSNVRERTFGVVRVELHEKVGKGTKNINTLADSVASAFKRLTADSVVYRTPRIVPAGQEDNWWVVNVTCPFYTDSLA